MEQFIKIKGTCKPITYVTWPVDKSWDKRQSIEIKAEITFAEAIEFFKAGTWSIWNKEIIQVLDKSPEELSEDEEPTYHEEVEDKEVDMSEYCVCGWIKDNMDGTCSVKMGKLSELEKLIETMLGGKI